jgi:hypothetical protein
MASFVEVMDRWDMNKGVDKIVPAEMAAAAPPSSEDKRSTTNIDISKAAVGKDGKVINESFFFMNVTLIDFRIML